MRLETRRKFGAAAVLSAPLAWTLAFLFIPYAIIFAYSFYEKKFPTFERAFQFGNYAQIISDPQYYQVLFRTASIALTVAAAALLLAYPFAYFLVFKVRSSRLRLALYMAVIVPLWVSYLLRRRFSATRGSLILSWSTPESSASPRICSFTINSPW